MCGRFALHTEPVKIARFLQATPEGVKDGWHPSWNIPPTERIVGARERVDDNGEVTRTLGLYRWGLVPGQPAGSRAATINLPMNLYPRVLAWMFRREQKYVSWQIS
jgi:putative SOS response-associated peptidase YedK